MTTDKSGTFIDRGDEAAADERDMAWLFARARGENTPHPDPARAAAYERLEQALAGLPLPNARPGWQRRVWAAIAESLTK